ncbi:DedA family protein [Lutispora thermophila]|uniref:Membrane protein DedA, SNARE-associated domain n=1 Tax=Lutispora thermophila DSM 19022 TaxID=1122184 RepID=A0A1M6BZ42_9FIRM|nr:DedA family protein [Lutispora thermophila]SHI54066.1 membrane protein DedA, SNARE-associated domain [Lutispora thermophila DSM 19022]
MTNIFEALFNYLIEITGEVGYIGVIVLVGLEYACFPMPSEIILPFVGFLASSGKMSYLGVLAASTLAGILGSLICYYIGYFGGKPILDKIGDKVPSSRKSIFAAKNTFDKYDKLSVMIARVLPLARTYISIPAGIARMSMLKFISFSSIGIVVWNTVLISLGYYLGTNWMMVEQIMEKYTIFIAVILIIFAAIYFFNKRKK